MDYQSIKTVSGVISLFIFGLEMFIYMEASWHSYLDRFMLIFICVSMFECFYAALCCNHLKSFPEFFYRLVWVFIFFVCGLANLVCSTEYHTDSLCESLDSYYLYGLEECPFSKYRMWIGILSSLNSVAYLVATPKSSRCTSGTISRVSPLKTTGAVSGQLINALTMPNDPWPQVHHHDQELPPPYSSLSLAIPAMNSIEYLCSDAEKSTSDEMINGNANMDSNCPV